MASGFLVRSSDVLWEFLNESIEEFPASGEISLQNTPEFCVIDWTAVDESIVEFRKVERDIRRCKDISMEFSYLITSVL